jgi:prepilin-type N-terminal cleavage/methylation domain-containing protein
MARSATSSKVPGGRGAFTLIEIMIVVVILALLGVILVANATNFIGLGRAEAMSANVGHIREQIGYQAATQAVPLAPSGYPLAIDAAWFQQGRLPRHTWTGGSLVIEAVNGNANDWFPATKTFDIGAAGATNAWYNVTNGSFCALVADEGDAAETLEMFNIANNVQLTSLAQTTRP